MTWNEMEKLLGELRRTLPSPQTKLGTWEKPSGVFELLERQTSEALDAAVREFARTRTWPELSPDQKTMLGFRADWAWHIVAALTQADEPEKLFPTNQLSDTEQLDWALIDAWGWPGSDRWQSIADRAPDKSSGVPPTADSSN